MKMKRYYAADMRLAMRKATDELGADALILSNRKVSGGVELIAAIDYESDLGGKSAAPIIPADTTAPRSFGHVEEASPSLQAMQNEIRELRSLLEVPLSKLASSEEERRHPLRVVLMKRLQLLGLHKVVAEKVLDRVMEYQSLEHAWRASLSVLESMLPVAGDEILSQGGVVAMVGPTGVGKTTTVAKLAAQFALRHGRNHVGLVAMDSYRIGAHDQLQTYGKLLGVPVYLADTKEELESALAQLSDRRLVLIDTAGTGQRDKRLKEQLASLEVSNFNIQRNLVLSAAGHMALYDEVIRAFRHHSLQHCIITKVDEATSLGEVFSVLIKNQLPLAYIGDGQRVPDDLSVAQSRRLVTQADALLKINEDILSDHTWTHALNFAENTQHVEHHA